ncbi:MAG: DUF1538 domain-containing protein [Christensenellales bacterium]|jgi:hypothetical protein
MSLLRQKVSEVSRSLLPIISLVLFLAFAIVKPDSTIILRFLMGSVLLLIGLAIFLLGVDLGINPIGDHMAVEVATSKTRLKVAGIAFLLGFLVTVAEPDLLILGKQVQDASGGGINAHTMVYLVSAGVGMLIMFGTFRLLRGRSFPLFMGIAYFGIFVLSLFVSEEFLAISFDSSGATTGALTTPFILALSAGLSRIKGGDRGEEDAFGLVGVMSAGPMYALMLMSIITGQSKIQGEAVEFAVQQGGVFGPLLHHLPNELIGSLTALLPLASFFFLLNFLHLKAPRREIARIVKGLIYTLLGLTLFLAGVYSGFLDMGQLIGRAIAAHSSWLLPVTGFFIGMIVVLVEPAVIVLGQQIELATGGRIPGRIIKMTLSIGVALAVMLSMLRIMIPALKLWHFLLPGFGIAVLLSFRADPVFVGIAYDAGGVASGPMTATFVLAFAQGAAHMVPGANVLVDAFGVIAMVAMAPVLSLMIVGAIFRHKEAAHPKEEAKHMLPKTPLPEGKIEMYDCVVAIINRGLAQRAVELAREVGAGGATILHGRGSGTSDMRLFSMDIQKEKEIIFWLTDTRVSEAIAAHLYEQLELGGEGGGTVFMMPSGAFGIDIPVTIGQRVDEEEKEHAPKEPTTAEDLLPADVATEDLEDEVIDTEEEEMEAQAAAEDIITEDALEQEIEEGTEDADTAEETRETPPKAD